MVGVQPEANLTLLSAMKGLSLAAAVVGLCISSTLGTASKDGDPLNNYQFTSDIPIEAYVEQGRTRVYRSGLWTVQRFQHLDAFAGETWDLNGNRKERVGVFYGTWPKWASDYSYDSSIHSRSFREEGSAPAAFELVLDTFGSSEPDPGLLAVDYTASGAITLWIKQWNGGANSGSSSMILRLSGSDAANSKVEVLWEGQYETLEDLDGDGEPEIIDTDWTHRYASYLPHEGVSTRAVLDWDPGVGPLSSGWGRPVPAGYRGPPGREPRGAVAQCLDSAATQQRPRMLGRVERVGPRTSAARPRVVPLRSSMERRGP